MKTNELTPVAIREMADNLECITLCHTWEPHQYAPDAAEEADRDIRDNAAYMLRDCADALERQSKGCEFCEKSRCGTCLHSCYGDIIDDECESCALFSAHATEIKHEWASNYCPNCGRKLQ